MASKTSLVIAVLVFAISSAQAATDPPLKAKKLVFDLVRAYPQCTTPNTFNLGVLGTTACQPGAPTTTTPPLELGPKGTGRVTVAVTKGPDIKIKAKITDVRSGGVPYDGSPLWITTSVRLTEKNCAAGPDCTQSDIPAGVYVVPIPCVAGTCKGTRTLNVDFQPGLVVAGREANVHILTIEVHDVPFGGTPFLVPGLFIP